MLLAADILPEVTAKAALWLAASAAGNALWAKRQRSPSLQKPWLQYLQGTMDSSGHLPDTCPHYRGPCVFRQTSSCAFQQQTHKSIPWGSCLHCPEVLDAWLMRQHRPAGPLGSQSARHLEVSALLPA